MLAHKSDKCTIITPYHVFDRWAVELGNSLLLLDVIEDHRGRGAQDKTSRAPIENLVCLDGRLDGLNSRV